MLKCNMLITPIALTSIGLPLYTLGHSLHLPIWSGLAN